MNREPAAGSWQPLSSAVASSSSTQVHTPCALLLPAAAAAGCACGPHVMSCHLSPRVCAVEEESDVS